MSKKVFIVLSVVLLSIAAIACTVFLIATQDLEPESRELTFDGSWRVFADGNADQQAEYFVFKDGQVKDYRQSDTPYFESNYTVSGSIIHIDKLQQDFSVEQKTDNVRLLYNQTSTYLIVKCSDGEPATAPVFTAAELQGNYTVNLHGNNVAGNETISFDGDRFICRRNGETYLDTTFTVENNVLMIGTMKLHICSVGDTLLVVEAAADAKYLGWEMTKAAG